MRVITISNFKILLFQGCIGKLPKNIYNEVMVNIDIFFLLNLIFFSKWISKSRSTLNDVTLHLFLHENVTELILSGASTHLTDDSLRFIPQFSKHLTHLGLYFFLIFILHFFFSFFF